MTPAGIELATFRFVAQHLNHCATAFPHFTQSKHEKLHIKSHRDENLSRDSSVGIPTRYELDCPGIESPWGRDFPHPSRRLWGPPSLLYNGYRVFPGGKAAGAWRWPPTQSIAEVKERVELYVYSPPRTSWPVLGWTLPLPLPLPLPHSHPSMFVTQTPWRNTFISR